MAIASKYQQNSNDEHSNSNNNNNDNKLSNDELEVANILLDLPYLMTKSLSNYRFEYHWGSKKPRSILNYTLSYPPLTRRPPLLPVGSTTTSKIEAAASPNTPLSFSPPSPIPTHSDYSKSNNKPRHLHFLRKEELEHTVKERLHTQQQLKESIEKVQVYYKSLIAENSELKARKRKLEMNMNMREKISEERLKVARTSCTSTSAQEEVRVRVNDNEVPHHHHHVHAGPSTSGATHHHTPLMINGANDADSVYRMHHHHQAVSSGGNNKEDKKPLICIDLNMSPEEAENAERKRRCEEARRHRLHVHNNKKKLTRVRH